MTHGHEQVPAGISRHFEGWQPGLLAVFIAGTAALLVVPRAAPPDVLPEPDVDRRAIARAARADADLARSAARTPLDTEVRALGDAFHAYNLALAGGAESGVAERRRGLAKAAARALSVDAHGTLALRAYELETFVRAARACGAGVVAPPAPPAPQGADAADAPARAPTPCDRLTELASVYAGREPAWRAELAADEAALRVYFKTYWNEVTGMSTGAFALAPDELRAGLRFGLLHPRVPVRDDDTSTLATVTRDHARWRLRLRKIEEIAAADPGYPRDYARGVALYALGEYPAAAEAFRAHLERFPDGPLEIRARNHLRATLERARNP